MSTSLVRMMTALACVCALGSGCAWTTSSPSTKGRAFVVKGGAFGSTFWNCDATKGDPTCYQVKQIRNEK